MEITRKQFLSEKELKKFHFDGFFFFFMKIKMSSLHNHILGYCPLQ